MMAIIMIANTIGDRVITLDCAWGGVNHERCAHVYKQVTYCLNNTLL